MPKECLSNWVGRHIELDLYGNTYKGRVIRVEQVIFPKKEIILVANILVNDQTVAMRFSPDRCRQLN